MKRILLLALASLPLCAQPYGYFPDIPYAVDIASALTTAATLNAANQKVAMCGSVDTRGAASKAIRKVGWKAGASVKAGGSSMLVSLQDIDTANGTPARPDGTQDQTAVLANGSINTSATFYVTGALSADRTVSNGDYFCVVIEFNSFAGSDSMIIQAATTYNSSNQGVQPTLSTYNGTTWSNSNNFPIAAFEFSDGTYGAFFGGMSVQARNGQTYNNGSGTDEYALRVVCSQPTKFDAVRTYVNPAGATSDFDLVWYNGTTAIQTVSVDANTLANTGTMRSIERGLPEVTCLPGNTYYMAIKPTTANNIQIAYWTFVSNAALGASGPTSWHLASRVDAGAWSTSTVDRPLIQLRISSFPAQNSGGFATTQ